MFFIAFKDLETLADMSANIGDVKVEVNETGGRMRGKILVLLSGAVAFGIQSEDIPDSHLRLATKFGFEFASIVEAYDVFWNSEGKFLKVEEGGGSLPRESRLNNKPQTRQALINCLSKIKVKGVKEHQNTNQIIVRIVKAFIDKFK